MPKNAPNRRTLYLGSENVFFSCWEHQKIQRDGDSLMMKFVFKESPTVPQNPKRDLLT